MDDWKTCPVETFHQYRLIPWVYDGILRAGGQHGPARIQFYCVYCLKIVEKENPQ